MTQQPNDKVPEYYGDTIITREQASKYLAALMAMNEKERLERLDDAGCSDMVVPRDEASIVVVARLKRLNDALKTCNSLLEKLLIAYRTRDYRNLPSLLDHLSESKDLVQRLETVVDLETTNER